MAYFSSFVTSHMLRLSVFLLRSYLDLTAFIFRLFRTIGWWWGKEPSYCMQYGTSCSKWQ